MSDLSFTFSASIQTYVGKTIWHYVMLSPDDSDHIKFFTSHRKKRGWGSVRVEVKLNHSVWQTSVFPDAKKNAYMLPMKAEIRKENNLSAGCDVTLTIRVLE